MAKKKTLKKSRKKKALPKRNSKHQYAKSKHGRESSFRNWNLKFGAFKESHFTCPHCGYEAHKLAGYSHCPLCLICDRCKKKVRHCSCKEGE